MLNNRMMPQIFHNTSGGGGGSGNPLELLIGLGIDTTTEKTNLTKQIEKIKGLQAQLDSLTLSENAKKNLSNEINKLVTTDLKITAKLDIEATKAAINKQLKALKFDDVEVKVKVNPENGKAKNKPTQTSETKQNTVSPSKVKVDQIDFKDLDKLRNEYEKKGFSIKVHTDELTGAIKKVQAIGKEAQNIGKQLTFVPTVDKSGVSGFNLKDSILSDNESKSLTNNFKRIEEDFVRLNKSGQVAQNALAGLEKHLNNLRNKSLDGTLNNTHLDNFTERLKRMKQELTSVPSFMNKVTQEEQRLQAQLHKGNLTLQQYNDLSARLRDIKANGSNAQLTVLKNETSAITTQMKQLRELGTEVSRAATKYKEIEAAMTRIQKQNPKTFNRQEADRLKSALEGIAQQYTKIDGNGNKQLKFVNLAEAQKAMQSMRDLNAQVKQFGANAAEAGRNSMTLWDSFKVAMSKFPVWLLSGGIIFSTINSMKDMVSVIIEIDTQMTNLKKVMDESTDFGKVFDDATESAKRLGIQVSEVAKSYVQFAKQGYKGEELQGLGDTAIIASNTTELSAEEASGYITSALAQWKMGTDEAMRLIDSWNEIGNNYATSVDILAKGTAKSASTAKAMGMTFDELNAMIGTISGMKRLSENAKHGMIGLI